MVERSLQHRDADSKDDETLRREARVHLASAPALQLVAELIARLRELDLPWWTPVKLRERWGAIERMGWFRERSDIRQQITTSLTGLSPRAARRKTPDFQGALIDSVIDEGDITPRAFEVAFDPRDLAVYGPASEFWQFFCESMPWDEDTPQHQEIVAWLLKALLADRSPFEGISRKPILTPWDVRTAIDGRLWQTRIPLEIRVAIDSARLKQERERPGVPFHAASELAIAGPDVIAANIPPREILPVVLLAQKAMRFDPPRAAQKADAPKSAAVELSSAQGSSAVTAAPSNGAPAASAPASSGGAPAASAPVPSGSATASAPAASVPVPSNGAPDGGQAGKPAAGAALAGAPQAPVGAPAGGLPAAVSSPPGASSTAPRPAGNSTPPSGAAASTPGALAARPPSAAGAPAGGTSPPPPKPPSDPGASSARPSAPPAPRASTPPAPPVPRASAPPPPPAPRASAPPPPSAALSPLGIESLDDLEAESDGDEEEDMESERTNPWAVAGDDSVDADLDDLDAAEPSEGGKPPSGM